MMSDEAILHAILNNDPGKVVIESTESVSSDGHRIKKKYRLVDEVVVVYSYTDRKSYLPGVVYASMPREQIRILKPENRVIYKTDWMDDIENSNTSKIDT